MFLLVLVLGEHKTTIKDKKQISGKLMIRFWQDFRGGSTKRPTTTLLWDALLMLSMKVQCAIKY